MEVENMSKKYRSPAMAAVHEMMSDLHEAGVVDKVTMRHFDDQCLTPIQEMTPSVIVSLRKRERASQAVFARYLNIPPEPCQPMGARRETSEWSISQAAVPGEGEGPVLYHVSTDR
jgi:DNA-binding transcriptional regulator YiaG